MVSLQLDEEFGGAGRCSTEPNVEWSVLVALVNMSDEYGVLQLIY